MRTERPGPFSVLVHDLVGAVGEMREVDLDVSLPEHWGEGIVEYPQGAPVHVGVRLESVHEGILASAVTSATYTGECGRCLKALSQPVEVEFQELFAYSGPEENDFEVRDDRVDLESCVRDALVLALPFQPVCRPDCPGLAPETSGLDVVMPETDTAASVDPRWSALAALTVKEDDGADAPQA